jgi:hypothetical protein
MLKDSSVSFPSRYVTVIQDFNADSSPNGPASTSDTTRKVVARRTREGTRLPGWHKIIQDGGNATTPLSGVLETVYSKQISVEHKWINVNDGSYRVQTANGDVVWAFIAPAADGGVNPGDLIDSSVADNRARTRFYKRLRELQVQMSGPTFLGELRETLRMIRHPAQAIRDSCDRYYRSLKQWRGSHRPPSGGHKKWQWRQELEKIAGGLWLENSFGWQPALNDIRDAVKAYERLTHPNIADRKTISVGGTDGLDVYNGASGMGYGDGQSHLNIGSFSFYMYLSLARASCTVRYKGKVKTSTEATTWDDLALFGFTPSEFVPTAWELLPWSFLADYFANIGDILSSSVTKTSDVCFVCQTIRRRTRLYGHMKPTSNRPGGFPWDWQQVIVKDGQANWELNRTSLSRNSGGGVPLPVFQFEPGLNVGQMANITALLTNFLDVHPQDKPRRNWHR